MTTFIPGAPQQNEYAPFYATYVEKANWMGDPTKGLHEQLDRVLDLLTPVDANKQLFRYAAGKWSVKEVFGHDVRTDLLLPGVAHWPRRPNCTCPV